MISKDIQGTEPILFVYDPQKIEEKVLENMLVQGTYPIKSIAEKNNILEYIVKEKIRIVLISIHISFIDPYELCYQISVLKKSLPILLITSSPDLVDIPKAFAMGISDIICAPYIKALIWVRIETYLRLHCYKTFIESEYISKKTYSSDISQKNTNESKEDFKVRKQYKFSNTSVLLAEDNEMNQQLMKNILEKAGINIKIVSNGQEAVDCIKEKLNKQASLFDAILMDIRMPVLDGFLATKKIQELLETNNQPEIPVIAITAHTQSSTREKCLRAGMLGYLAKPIDPENCLEMLSQWIHFDKVSMSEKQNNPIQDQQSSLHVLKIEGLNVKTGLKRAAGNESLYRNLLLDFYKEYQKTGEKLLDLEQKKQFKDLKVLVHTLKGLGGNLGAEKLYKKALLLEKAIKSNLKDEIKTALNELVETINDIIEGIKEKIPVLESNKKINLSSKLKISNNIDDETLKLKLKELFKLLDEGRTTAIYFFNDLLSKISKEQLPISEELNILISSYDYEKAQKVLSKFIA